MKKINKLRARYINLTMITTFIQLLLAVFVGSIFILSIDIPNKNLVATIIAAIVGISVIYNILIFRPLAKKNEFSAKYLQCFFVIAQMLVLVYFFGGINSPWYLVLLMLIIGCSVLGFGAFFINIGIMAVFYVAIIIASLAVSTASEFSFATFPTTASALLFAGLIAYAIDQYQIRGEKAYMVTSELDSAKLTEKIMLGAIADPIIGVDAKARIILMNESAQSLCGWDMYDALHISFRQVLKLKDSHDLDITDTNDPFLQVINRHQPITTSQFYVLRKGNEKIALSISIAPTINADGKHGGAIAVITDISAQKTLERERSEFISTASHEMRTPLATIEGYLSIALNPKLSNIDENARLSITKAHEASIHMGKLFQDLLSVSVIDDSVMANERTIFNISDLVLKISAAMEPLANQKGLQIITHIGGASLSNQKVVAPAYMIHANEERVTEIITNLLDNAVKYTAKGGVDINISGDKATVTIAIEDSGIGISAQDQKHLFEKFYRVNNSLTHEQPGTGLGLYITRNLVELYGGKIWVESVPGQGSTFTFRLPLNLNVA